MPQAHALITGDAYLPVSASGANHWSAAVLVFSEKAVPYSVCMSQQLPSISTAADNSILAGCHQVVRQALFLIYKFASYCQTQHKQVCCLIPEQRKIQNPVLKT